MSEGEKKARVMSTEEIALSRMGFGMAQPSAGELIDAIRVQRGIARTMAEVIAHPSNPNALNPAPSVAVPVGAGRVVDADVRGWREPDRLRTPPGQEIIEQMVNASLPHGKGWGEKK